MVVIRAHFDGSVIVPDEPLLLAAQSQVVVLVDSIGSESAGKLEEATRDYYQAQSCDDLSDEGWGSALSRDSRQAWDQE
jgi:hypothetical protein